MNRSLFEELSPRGHRILAQVPQKDRDNILAVLSLRHSFNELTIDEFLLISRSIGQTTDVIDVYKTLFN